MKEEFLEIFREENAQIHLADYHRAITSEYFARGDTIQGIEHMDQNLAMYRQLGDWIGVGERSTALAYNLIFQANYPRARLLVQEAIAIARRLRTRAPEAGYWLTLLEIARAEGSYREGNGYAETALIISRQENDTGETLRGLWMRAENVWSMGDLDWAKRCADEILELCLDRTFFREIGHYLYGRIALTAGRLAEAEAQLRESLRWMDDLFWPGQKANHLMGWVVLFSQQGKLARAVRLAGAIEEQVISVYPELSPFERFEYERALDALRIALPVPDYAAAWAEGKELALDQAQTLVME